MSTRWRNPGFSAADWANELKDKEFGWSFAAMANSKTTKKQWVAPANGTITGIWATSANTAAGANTDLTMTCAGNNCLGATVALDGLTLNTQTEVALNSTAANLQFESGDVLEATIVTDGGGTLTDAEVRVAWTMR